MDSTMAAPYPREQAREIIEFWLSHNVHWARRLVGKHSIDRGGSLSRAAVSWWLTMRMSDCGSLKGRLKTGAGNVERVMNHVRAILFSESYDRELLYSIDGDHRGCCPFPSKRRNRLHTCRLICVSSGVREQRSGCSAAVEHVKRRSEDHEGLMKQLYECIHSDLEHRAAVPWQFGQHCQSVHGAYKRGRVVTTLALIRIRQRSKSRRPFKGGLCIGLADVGVMVLKRLRAVSGQEGHHIDVLDHMRWSDSSIFMRLCTYVSTADNEQRVDCSWAEENDVWDVLDHVRWSEGSRSCRTTALELRVRFDSRLGLLGGMRRTVWKRSEEQLHKCKHGGSKQLWAVSKWRTSDRESWTIRDGPKVLRSCRRSCVRVGTTAHEWRARLVTQRDYYCGRWREPIENGSTSSSYEPFPGGVGHRVGHPGPCGMVRRFRDSRRAQSQAPKDQVPITEDRRKSDTGPYGLPGRRLLKEPFTHGCLGSRKGCSRPGGLILAAGDHGVADKPHTCHRSSTDLRTETTQKVVEGALCTEVHKLEGRQTAWARLMAAETQARTSAECNAWLNGHVLNSRSHWRWSERNRLWQSTCHPFPSKGESGHACGSGSLGDDTMVVSAAT
ncbi:hypothetical protein JOM56_013668 [Amanita muscaria]